VFYYLIYPEFISGAIPAVRCIFCFVLRQAQHDKTKGCRYHRG